jgi:hypothetical protein
MSTTNRRRAWRVLLTDGRTLDIAARKVHVTDACALMLFEGDWLEPAYIWSGLAWLECLALREPDAAGAKLRAIEGRR